MVLRRRSSIGRYIEALGVLEAIAIVYLALATEDFSLYLCIALWSACSVLIAVGQFLTYHAEMADAMDKVAAKEAEIAQTLARTDDILEIVGIALGEINGTLRGNGSRSGPDAETSVENASHDADEDEKARIKRLLREKMNKGHDAAAAIPQIEEVKSAQGPEAAEGKKNIETVELYGRLSNKKLDMLATIALSIVVAAMFFTLVYLIGRRLH